jgi:hypothetical protein
MTEPAQAAPVKTEPSVPKTDPAPQKPARNSWEAFRVREQKRKARIRRIQAQALATTAQSIQTSNKQARTRQENEQARADLIQVAIRLIDLATLGESVDARVMHEKLKNAWVISPPNENETLPENLHPINTRPRTSGRATEGTGLKGS